MQSIVTPQPISARLPAIAALWLLGALLSGCVGRSAAPSPDPEDEFPTRIYGLLERQEQGFAFTRFSLANRDRHPVGEAWVDLKSLQPAFDTAPEECRLGLFDLMEPEDNKIGAQTRILCDGDGPLFRTAHLDVDDLAKNTVGNLVTQVSGIGVAGYFTTEFDQSAYRAALAEASRDFNFARFTAAARTLLGRYRQALTEDRQASDALRDQLRERVRINFEDHTGSGVLDAPTLRARLQVEIDRPPFEPLPGLFFSDLEDFEGQLAQRIAADRAKIQVRLRCPAPEGFTLTIEGCERRYAYADFNDALTESAPVVTYRIHTRQRVRFVPSFPPFGNDTLRIQSLGDGRIQAHNLGGHPLVFESVSLTLNGDIATLFILNQRLEADQVDALPALESFDNYEEQMVFEAIDADTLATPARYALEVVYTDTGSGVKQQVQGSFSGPYGDFTQRNY